MPLPPFDLFEIQRSLEFLDQPALPRTRVPADADNRSLPLPQSFDRLRELGHFGLAADQLRPRPGQPVDLTRSIPPGEDLVDPDRLRLPFERGGLHLLEPEIPLR